MHVMTSLLVMCICSTNDGTFGARCPRCADAGDDGLGASSTMRGGGVGTDRFSTAPKIRTQ